MKTHTHAHMYISVCGFPLINEYIDRLPSTTFKRRNDEFKSLNGGGGSFSVREALCKHVIISIQRNILSELQFDHVYECVHGIEHLTSRFVCVWNRKNYF